MTEQQERDSAIRETHSRILAARRVRKNLMLKSTQEDIEAHNKEAEYILALLADVTPDDARTEDPLQVEMLDEMKNAAWSLIVREARLGLRNGWLT